MPEIPRIEEPPPIRRSRPQPPVQRGFVRLIEWRRTSARQPEPTPPHEPKIAVQEPQIPDPSPGTDRKALVLGLAALTLMALQGYTLHRLGGVRTDLAGAETSLEEVRASLGSLRETTRQLDADQMSGLAQLMDSVRSVFAYAKGEISLWEAAYQAHGQRLEENAGRIAGNAAAITRMTSAARAADARLDELAGFDAAQLLRLQALEEQDRTQASTLEALVGRAGTQEATLVDMTTGVATLRDILGDLDAELARLEDQLAASGSAYGELDTRIETLAAWVDGFRQAGLSGPTVDSRLTTLADELRRVRMRVDSLRRPVRTAVRTMEGTR